ncbi:LysR family transcriptional regulator ArgP [Sulfitobacter sp. PS-8MA]|uniref:LysR family transcriptional regulator ArgP n=1 Tax=Sulfitobacter sp. PS-8MA TaxID=3237707 RepID=UPI0034C69B97
MQLDSAQLTALAHILRLGSFDAAAAALGVTPSAISQRLKALEDRVGATLVLRGQPCRPTPLGQRLAKHAEDVALLEAQALGQDTGHAPPRLRLAVPADVLATWLIPALAQIPEMLFDLVIDDQDTSADWLRRGEVSAAVTGQSRAAPGCDLRPLGAMRYLPTASPDYVAKWFAQGVTPATLGAAPMLTFDRKDQLQTRWLMQKTGQRLTPPSHHLPSSHGFVTAARAGLGWGMNPAPLVAKDMEEGRLVSLDDALPLDVPLYWQVARIIAPALAPLTAAIKAAAREALVQSPR